MQTLGTFVLRFRYFEFTACDCRSLEFTIGPGGGAVGLRQRFGADLDVWGFPVAHKYFKLAGRGYECLFGTADFALEKGR